MVELAVPVPLVGGYPLLSALEQSFDMLELSSPLSSHADLAPFTTSLLAAGSQPVLPRTSASEPTAAQALPPHDQRTFFSALDWPPVVDLTEPQPTRSFAAMLGARWGADRDSWTPTQPTSEHSPPPNAPFADFINRAIASDTPVVSPMEQLPTADDEYDSDGSFTGALVLPTKLPETSFDEYLAHRERTCQMP